MTSPPEFDRYKEYFSGIRLYGDDLSLDEIKKWFDEEKLGYFNLVAEDHRYDYGAFNDYHFFRHLTGTYKNCLAIGCANGEDIAPISDRVANYIAIEPATQWWSARIGGKPAQYLMPDPSGNILIDSGTIQLASSFGVLHHIPNVSHVIGEVARVLVSGGTFILREPISSMGDWRRPRVGLTKNERGLPLGWLESTLKSNGFQLERKRLCMFAPIAPIARRLRIDRPFDKKAIVILDELLSGLTAWNSQYVRDNLVKKVAPGAVAIISRKL